MRRPCGRAAASLIPPGACASVWSILAERVSCAPHQDRRPLWFAVPSLPCLPSFFALLVPRPRVLGPRRPWGIRQSRRWRACGRWPRTNDWPRFSVRRPTTMSRSAASTTMNASIARRGGRISASRPGLATNMPATLRPRAATIGASAAAQRGRLSGTHRSRSPRALARGGDREAVRGGTHCYQRISREGAK